MHQLPLPNQGDEKMKPSVADRILQRLQGFTEALEKGETIAKRFTCHKILLDLKPQLYPPEKVKETRKLLGASQKIFAQLLGVSVRTVHSWEQGINPPKDMACRFMDEIRINPRYWKKRLLESAVAK
jgi:putative transcriptional regulator